MYNNLSKTRRGRPWLLLAALFAWLLPQTAAAEQFIHDPDNYSVSLGGSNIVYFTAPIYDQKNADQWVENGQLQVSVDGAAPKSIFMWYAVETGIEGIDGDATEVKTRFSAHADGFFDITLGNTNSTIRLTKGNYNRANVKRNNDGYSFTFAAEWVVPYNLLGKKLTFSWVVTRNGNINAWESTRVTGLKTVRFIDRMMKSGVRVFKIEGRARGPEYVYTVVTTYKEAIKAVLDGTFTEEKKDEWDARLATVFNRGFWDGYYQGQLMGEWNKHYGSNATERKVYIGKGCHIHHTCGWTGNQHLVTHLKGVGLNRKLGHTQL